MTEVRIGVDVGGTFTDVVTIHDGRVEVTKTPSTPDAPEEGVIDGLERARGKAGYAHSDVSFLSHGTTVATNAVLERDWAETALVTTEGFRDALEIGRQTRPDLYDLCAEKPRPVVERDRRFEVAERLDERGRVVEAPDEANVRDLADDLADVESVAISLLFSFENDDHERRVRDILAEEVDASFSLSSRVLPEIREYERTLATALNAALRPVMDEYIGGLDAAIADLGVPADLRVMQSNGGVMPASEARRRPVNTLLSGPAAGVAGAAHVAGIDGMEDVVTMDMGGTSCDVSLVRDGDPVTSTAVEVGDYPVGVPAIDVHTIGAGGGSIARVDAGGALRVGPESAGADPGPICYGRGGTEPTVTDAHYLLGRIDPGRLLDDPGPREDVEAAVEPIADALGATIPEAARGILDVADASMERALRVVSVERGHDPRDLGLVAFGGAGPLHATELAERLGVPRVLVPRTAGVLSALGLLVGDVVRDFGASHVRPWDEVDPGELRSRYETFEDRARDRLGGDLRFERAVDLRYAGQSFDLRVELPGGPLDGAALDDVATRFHDRHRERYGHASPDEPLELVTLRLRARAPIDPPDLVRNAGGSIDDAIREKRAVGFDDGRRDARVYERSTLPSGATFDGPAIVEGDDATVVVRPGDSVEVTGRGDLLLEVGRDG